MCSSNFAFEELVIRSLRASPLMKPLLTPGGSLSAGLKCVQIKIRVLFESVAVVYTHVSKNVISVSKIAAVNFIV